MPLEEGHWQRASTPLYKLSRRERFVVLGLTALTAIVIAVILVANLGNTRPPPGPGCIRALTPNVMGAEELNACGARAERLCARFASDDDPVGDAVEASCREAGVPSRAPR